ncbi:MAG: hypothetical protein J5680_03550, partial [Neisseriaceae bacterium]|nr:hypothetical protein [Neisseriaceae bacterium]
MQGDKTPIGVCSNLRFELDCHAVISSRLAMTRFKFRLPEIILCVTVGGNPAYDYTAPNSIFSLIARILSRIS